MPKRRGSKPRFRRSTFEKRVEQDLEERGVKAKYEPKHYRYVTFHQYTPDYLLPNGIFIEVKGWFTADDRKKLLKIREAYPTLDVRLVFDRDNKIHKVSKTHYSDWCDKHGFKWALKTVPQEWLEEPPKEIPKSLTKKALAEEVVKGKLK